MKRVARNAAAVLALVLEYSQGPAEVVEESIAAERALEVAGSLAEGEEGSMVDSSVLKLQHHLTSCAEKVGRGIAASLDCRCLVLLGYTVGREEGHMNRDVLVAGAAVAQVVVDAVKLLGTVD